jgi:hypothetical protein
MNTFEKWWEEYYWEYFKGQSGPIPQMTKNIAKEAWMEAYTLGYRKGVEAAEYDDTK